MAFIPTSTYLEAAFQQSKELKPHARDIISLISVPMLCRSAVRPLLRSAKLQCRPQPQLYFSSTFKADSPAQPTNHERTTHFGFETVTEAEKEGRGTLPDPLLHYPANSIYSGRRIQQRSSLLRHYERLHVPRYPPPLERLLRALH